MHTAAQIADKSDMLPSALGHLSTFGILINHKDSLQKIFTINNRRYLGNKYKLLPFIQKVVAKECGDVDVVADVFAGTGAVASAFTDKKIITNDILYSNYICHVAWFSPEAYSEKKVSSYVDCYNRLQTIEDNYMSKNFANTYFSLSDCRKIGFVREDIEKNWKEGKLNEKERALLITSLIYAMDKIANTCGHYDAYRQNVAFDKHLKLLLPRPERHLHPENVLYNEDINKIICNIKADLVYIDPPYNSRQYCDTYHLLENVARWEKPEVFGVARKMDRQKLKSAYCTKNAGKAFKQLITQVRAKYILLSYNNMARKGNDRSNARISDEEIMEILSKKGTVKIFEEDYKLFTTGSTEINNNKERLFLCICQNQK